MTNSKQTEGFSVVGVGASAGGLEALEQFFAAMPVDSGMAFVVVQHLDRHHTSLLPELLQHATTMPVRQARHRMALAPDCIYVIPPDKDISLLHGRLQLHALKVDGGLHLPIDALLKSLAEDQKERAVGIVLSGMGADGAQGMKAIKENGGLLLVQDPESARFDSMPRSVIDAGLTELVAAAGDLPKMMLKALQHPALPEVQPEKTNEEGFGSAFDHICRLLHARTGNDFSQYKKSTIYRRIERRMGVHQIAKIADFVAYMQENPQETDLLFRELLIGVTQFFRDPAGWLCLENTVLPKMIANSEPGTTLRAWVAGCSTGEEAYSLAILFRELVEKQNAHERVSLQIFATDLDPDAVSFARQGLYPLSAAVDIPASRISRFFTEEQEGYRIRKDIRQMVVFAPQNIIMDPPFTKLDIIK